MNKTRIHEIMRRAMLVTVVVGACACPALHAGTLPSQVIGMFPKNVGEFAYADLRQARAFSWFPQLQQQMLPPRFQQFEKFLASAGVDPNYQVEELAWALIPSPIPPGSGPNAVPASEEVVGVALGNFQPDSTEAYFRAQKLAVVKVRNISLFAFGSGSGAGDLFFCFMDSNTAAFGQRKELEQLIAVRYGEAQGLLNNDEFAPLISQANGNGIVWAVLSASYARLAMQQMLPQVGQFPQAQVLISSLRALTIGISAGSGIQAHFEAVCASPDAANTFAALLQAGLMYQRYQVANSNPDLAALLDSASVQPSGDHLSISLHLSEDQVRGLISRRTFVLGM